MRAHPRRRPALARALAPAVAVALLLGACAGPVEGGGAGTADQPGVGSSQASGASETFDSPDVEPTTPESADASGSGSTPAVSVARLPIGGDAQPDDSDPMLQCAHVTWIASADGQVPEGTDVEITTVGFDPEVFEAVDDGCGSERPSCLDHAFRSAQLQCDLAVRATGEVPQDVEPRLWLGGLVHCEGLGADACRRFVDALGQEQQLSITLNVPPAASPSTDGG